MYGDTLLIEQWIVGREMTVGVLDTHGTCEAFPVIEIQTPEASWYDFNHRYTEGASSHIMPAPISDTLAVQLQSAAIKAHQALGCRDLSRTDFIVSEDSFVVLEVNTMPGMTPTSLYPEGHGRWSAVYELAATPDGRRLKSAALAHRLTSIGV